MDDVEVFAASREPDPERQAVCNRQNQKLTDALKLVLPATGISCTVSTSLNRTRNRFVGNWE